MKSHFSKNIFSSSRKAMTSLFFDCILRKMLITSGKDIYYQLIVYIQIYHLSRTEQRELAVCKKLFIFSEFLISIFLPLCPLAELICSFSQSNKHHTQNCRTPGAADRGGGSFFITAPVFQLTPSRSANCDSVTCSLSVTLSVTRIVLSSGAVRICLVLPLR